MKNCRPRCVAVPVNEVASRRLGRGLARVAQRHLDDRTRSTVLESKRRIGLLRQHKARPWRADRRREMRHQTEGRTIESIGYGGSER
jgi:hypothetical protein